MDRPSSAGAARRPGQQGKWAAHLAITNNLRQTFSRGLAGCSEIIHLKIKKTTYINNSSAETSLKNGAVFIQIKLTTLQIS